MTPADGQLRIVAFAGALRSGSLNRKLLKIAVAHAEAAGALVQVADLRELAIPVYDGDCEEAQGIPEGISTLAAQVAGSDALMLASPEYNFSVSGVMKNAVDWLSRVKPMPLKAKCAFLMSASPGLVGGNRGLWHLRVPLESLGTHVYPGMFSLASAGQAFDAEGALADAAMNERLRTSVEGFLKTAAALKAQ